MPDVVLLFKASPPSGMLPPGVKLVVVDPLEKCGGADPLCSTAYAALWQSLKDDNGRVLPNLLKKYNLDPATRVSLVGFSASHGFMNPFLVNDADRAATSAVILLDATFGGGKTGYIKAAQDAASGKMLMVSLTSDKGSTDALDNGDFAWFEHVVKPAKLGLALTSTKAPMPTPSKGVLRAGRLWYYRYSHAELPHWEMGKLLKPVLQAHLFGGAEPATKKSGIGLAEVLVVGAIALGAWKMTKRSTAPYN